MKRFIIVEHRAKEYANRLLSDMSVYAYALERGARIINISSLEQSRTLRGLYAVCAWAIDKYARGRSSLWAVGGPKFLSPTETMPQQLEAQKTLYFFGWLFRNPVGLEKYRKQVLQKFAPPRSVQKKVETRLMTIKKGRVRIGINMRLIPFVGFEDGEFLVPELRVRETVDEYVSIKNLRMDDVMLIITSDKPPTSELFEGYSFQVCCEDPATNLFLLTTCSVVIGTNTTTSNLAAWFANVPHIVTKRDPIDWEYYKDKSAYFENKYADLAQ